MITPKERLFSAIKRKDVDRPPCICPGGMMNMIIEEVMDRTRVEWPEAHSDPHLMARLTYGIYENGGFENVGVPFCMTVEAEAMGAEVFLGSKINEPRVSKYPIESARQWEILNKIDLREGRTKVVLDAIGYLKKIDENVPIIGNLTGPISLASSLMEPTYFYKELRKDPKKIHEYMNFVTKELIIFGRAQLEAGADIIAISDPGGTGEILGPKFFKEFAIPYLNKIVDELKPYAVGGIIIHICGKLESIYKELNELHSDAISIESATAIKEIAKNIEDKAIMGNVSTYAIEKNNSESVGKLSKFCIESGVHILAPACGIGVRSGLINIQSMVNVCKKYEK
ncbi:methylcobamide:CoM methyltransferase MtbA [Clostridium amazonitimonense]|uniref:methylcobamide:CoM methyltransferase MtbA n=1 Tax=Clostridium amazonitimonense TaxID=1499689 RepID=UPI0005097516|nr:methylcobamide:CoM methyltransferase MtbA [Clostridium amazonitimonense]